MNLGVGRLFPPGTDTNVVVDYIRNEVDARRRS